MSKSPARLLARSFRAVDDARADLVAAEMHADEMQSRYETARELYRLARRDERAARNRMNRAGLKAADCVIDAFRAA